MKLLRVFLGVVLVLLLVLALGLVSLPWVLESVAPGVAASLARDKLGVDVQLDRLVLSPRTGRLALRGLTVRQPGGLKPEPLLGLREIAVDIDVASLRRKPLIVSMIRVDGLRLNLIKNEQGEMNLPKPAASEQPGEAKSTPEGKSDDADPAEKPALWFQRIELVDSAVYFADRNTNRSFRVRFEDIQLSVRDLHVNPAAPTIEPAAVYMTAQLDQAPLDDALLVLQARLGPLGDGPPTMRAAFGLAGVELNPMGGLLPPGTMTTLGGDALDLGAQASMNPTSLTATIAVHMSGGQKYALAIGGTPSKPVFDQSGVLFSVASRMGGGVGRMVSNVGASGLALAGSTVDAAGELGKGAVHTVGNVGKGLFGIAKGIVTLDSKAIIDGVTTGTVGAVGSAVGTVGNTGGTLVKGVGSAAGETLGKADAARWRAAIPSRFEAARSNGAVFVDAENLPLGDDSSRHTRGGVTDL